MPKKIRANDLDVEKIQHRSMDLDLTVRNQFKLQPAHQSFVELTFNKPTKMVFVDGPAGSCKTYCAANVALHLLRSRSVDEVVYIRSIIESASRNMGSLPGEVDDKFQPWSIPLKEKLDELLDTGVSEALFRNGFVKAIPVNYVRGLTFKNSAVIVDESQNLTFSELTTIMTRFGEGSKMIVIGDTRQSDIGNSGFKKMYDIFNDQESEENGIYCFKFTEADIMRSEILKFIVKKLDS